MDDLLALFSALAANGTNLGAVMPQSDADDFASGASRIPFEVTEARRRG